MFTTLLNRSSSTEWQKIPWHEPDFSRRMLAEHLSQSHDLASRRFSTIDQQVQWIHHKILALKPAHILDLGCGPGFYVSWLSALGHTCTGLDFSPASIAYARENYPSSTYHLGDVRELDYGTGYDLVMMIYGELNAFSAPEAAQIVHKAYAALKPGGKLLLEVHPIEVVQRVGSQPSGWHTARSGLFSDEPYLALVESRYALDQAITAYYVFDAQSGAMTQYTSMLHAYTSDEYRRLLNRFDTVLFFPSLTGQQESGDLFVIVAEKAANQQA